MQPVYIEPSDEITTVIERLKAADDLSLALVVPKGAILLQSIVNLKLTKKAALTSGKEIVLITTDKIGRNLATQVGIPVYSRLDEKNLPVTEESEEINGEEPPKIIAGVKVHRYYDKDDPENETVVDLTAEEDREKSPEETGSEANRIDPIIPTEEPLAAPVEETEEPAEAPIKIKALDITVPEKTEEEKVTEKPHESEPRRLEVKADPDEVNSPENPDAKNPETSLSPESSAKLTANRQPEENKPKRKRNVRRLVMSLVYIVLISALTAAGLGVFYLPKTTVTLTVKPESWEKELVTAAKVAQAETSDDRLVIPAELLNAEVSDKLDYTSTGTKEIGEKATGSASIFNSYSSNPQTLPSGAKISANGRDFYTAAAVTVPGARVESGKLVAGSITVEVIADLAGPDSNLSNVTGTIVSPASNLYAQISSTTGGSSRQVNVISQTDIANAKNLLNKKLRDATLAKINEQSKGRDLIFDDKTDSFTMESFTLSAPAGTEATAFQVNGKGIMKRLVVDRSKLTAAVEARLKTEWPPDTNLIFDSTAVSKLEVNLTNQDASITSLSKGRKAQIVPVDKIKESLVRRRKEEGISLLGILVKNAEVAITQTPAWWPIKNFPYSPQYLKVETRYE